MKSTKKDVRKLPPLRNPMAKALALPQYAPKRIPAQTAYSRADRRRVERDARADG